MAGYNKNSRTDYDKYQDRRFEKAYSSSKNKKESFTKKSGATLHRDYVDKQTGEVVPSLFITAWNASKTRGMMSVIASPRGDENGKNKDGKQVRKTSNDKWENWSVKVKFKKTLQTEWVNGLYNKITGKLILKDYDMIINPKAKNGGYFGTFIK